MDAKQPHLSGRSFTMAGGNALHFGAACDLEQAVKTHLFGICPNNSGSTFLQKALATCRATWNLPVEGQRMAGFVGPVNFLPLDPGDPPPGLFWAAKRRWLDRFADPAAYDWRRSRIAWYFQAYARDPAASVFYTKSPPHLVVVDELARHFRNAKFLFMVRNPYAVCEGLLRCYRRYRPGELAALAALSPERTIEEFAAAHAVTCLAWQRRNVEKHGGRGAFFTYETMCAEPEGVAHDVCTLVPEIDDLDIRQRLPVKGRYCEMLTDMNARQIARLDAGQVAAFSRVFRRRRDVLDYFGYDLL